MRPLHVLAGLVLGVLVGAALAQVEAAWAATAIGVADTAGTLWVSAIRMTVVPLVVALLLVSVASVADAGALGRMGAMAIAAFVVLLTVSASLGALAAPLLLDAVPATAFGSTTVDAAAEAAVLARNSAARVPGAREWILSLVPTNPIAAAAEGAMLPLVLFSVLFAVALTRVAPAERDAVVVFFRGLRDALLVLVRWVIALAPIGVFALVVALVARLGASAAGAFGAYVLIVCGLLAVQSAALYPLVRAMGGTPLRRFVAGAWPAQAVALTTRSSLAALPAAIQGAEQTLRLPTGVTGFVLPLAVSIFKFSAPLSSVVGTLFVARLYQVDLAPTQVAFVAVAAVALSFSTPGIPAGNLVVLAPVFAGLGLPVDGLGVLIALDVIPDTLKTAGNVTANLAVTAIVARHA